jgi:hypothetical protein
VLELGAVGLELIGGLDMLLLGARLVIALLDTLVLGARLVIALLDGLLLGVWLVMALLDVLGLGVRLVMALLEMLLLGVRLVIALLETLLLGVRLVVTWLGLRLGETLREMLNEFDLGVATGVETGLETCRLDWLELPDLLSLDRDDLAAITGSVTSVKISSKKAKNKGWKVEKRFPVLDLCWFSVFCLLYSVFFFLVSIIRLLSSAFILYLSFHPLKAKNGTPVTKIPLKMSFFYFFCIFSTIIGNNLNRQTLQIMNS